MNIRKKKIDLYSVMNIILALLAVASFSISFIKLGQTCQTADAVKPVNIGGIANYLQFMTDDKLQIIISIALHNFCLALIAYLLSVFSCGIFGTPSLISAFFIAGLVIRASMNIPTFAFVMLEVIGMSLAVFGGAYVFNEHKKHGIKAKQMMIISLKFIGILILIYSLAAYIEASLIQSLWK